VSQQMEMLLVTLERIETQLADIAEKLASTASGTSSVNLKTSTRGHDIDVKCYANSPVTEAGNAAVAEYFRVAKEIEAKLMGQA
jgi:hypothetical protein